jgi:hypothetical protein
MCTACSGQTLLYTRLVGHAVDKIASALAWTSDLELQSAMCFLLTALVAFSDATHDAVISSGLVPQLVVLCRSKSEV